jgi:erythromycin esterase-like protein
MEMKLHPPLRDSVEHVLARACRGSCVASTRLLASDLNIDRPIRAIGLVYRRDDEIRSHYLRTTAARQFDAIIYLDTTSSVGTLEP